MARVLAGNVDGAAVLDGASRVEPMRNGSSYVANSKTSSSPSHRRWQAIRNVVTSSLIADRPVSPRVFRLCWWLIALYHLFNALFIFMVAFTHIYVSLPGKYEKLWLIQINQGLLSLAGWSMLAVAVAHLATLVANVYQSIRHRRLAFGYDAKPSTTPHKRTQAPTSMPRRVGNTILSIVLAPLVWMQSIAGENGLFGVQGKYFYVGFYARQAFEIVLQTFQAYQMSYSVQGRWINRLVISLVVVNCAFVPIVMRTMRGRPAARRITMLTIDLALDFVIIVIIPMAVIAPRIAVVDLSTGRFSDSYTYNDVWVTGVISECRQVMVSSGLDLVSTIFPHVTGLLTLDTIKGLIYRGSEGRRYQVGGTGTSKDRKPPQKSIHAKHGLFTPKNITEKAARVFYGFAFVWAIFVMSCHGTAQSHASEATSIDSCTLAVDAWFATNATCSVVQINCHREGFQGTDAEIAKVLSLMERSVLTRLIVSHCPALSIPFVLPQFNNLLYFEVFNSTVVEWPKEAALTKRLTPRVSQLHFVETNFTAFPQAVLTSNLPTNLGLLIYGSNLTEIPDRFHDVWLSHTWAYFSIEHTQLTALPPSFSRARSYIYSFFDNKLTRLHDDMLLGTDVLMSLAVSGNNVTTLPSQVGDTTDLYHVLAENTSIATLPKWFEPWWSHRRALGKSVVVSFKGSPLCSDPIYSEMCAGVSYETSSAFRIELITPQRRV